VLGVGRLAIHADPELAAVDRVDAEEVLAAPRGAAASAPSHSTILERFDPDLGEIERRTESAGPILHERLGTRSGSAGKSAFTAATARRIRALIAVS